jgi:hypothetical protein
LRQKESFHLCLFTWGNALRWGHYPTWLICQILRLQTVP